MAIPSQIGSQIFEQDQRINFKAHYWDTTTTPVRLGPSHAPADQLTAFGSGIQFELYNLLDSSFAPASVADFEAAMTDKARTQSILGYTAGSTAKSGVVPNIYSYWGAGAPVGANTAKQVVMKFTGYVHKTTDNVTLAFTGQGRIRVVYTPPGGSRTALVDGQLKEPSPSVNTTGVNSTVIRDEWGYVVAPARVYTAGTKVEIWYYQNGETWGGIAAKVIPGAATLTSDAFLKQLREAPVLGTSFMAKEVAPLAAQSIKYITDAEIKQQVGSVTEMRLHVAMAQNGEPNGYRLDTLTDELKLRDNASVEELKKGRLVHFEGGFKVAAPPTTNLFATTVGSAAQNFSVWSNWGATGTTYWTSMQQYDDPTLGMVFEGIVKASQIPYFYEYYPFTFAANQTYTLSFLIWTDSPTTVNIAGEPNWSDNLTITGTSSSRSVALSTVPQLVTITFTMPSTLTTPTQGIRWRVGTGGGLAGGLPTGAKVFLAQPQIELGSVATPFVNGTRTGEEIYPRFTGYIEDIFPDGDGRAVIECRSFEGKLAEPFDENNPDRLAYQAAGFILREQTAEPVFGIPAYDNWPVEAIVADLCARAGIDSYNLGLTSSGAVGNHGKFRFKDATTGADYYGARMISLRALAGPDHPVQLERNTNYGNVMPLLKDYLPKDDEYLFKPQVTQRLYDRLRAITEHLGYDFHFNAEGQCVVVGRNNPVYFQYATQPGTYATPTAGVDEKVNVGAVGGIYLGRKHSAGAWTRVVTGHFSRADLYVGIGRASDNLNGGKLQVLVERWNGVAWVTVQTTVLSTWADASESFYYDSPITTMGTNAALFTVASLPFDYYRLTISGAGPDNSEVDCHYRLNGVAIYERNPEQTFHTKGRTEQTFSTLRNTLQISPESNFKDLRNHVVVVGGRRATITDSEKLGNERVGSDNTAEREFHVSVMADPHSIYDPTSANFVGSKRMTVVFDDKVTDTDFARWLSRTILFRYRLPKTSARFTHTIVPNLELRDAVRVVEERNLAVNHKLWVTSFTEKWSPREATTDIDAVANPEIPSYQPREDVKVDTLFVDPADGKGEPIIGLTISYRNIYGRTVSNSTLYNDTLIKGFTTRTKGSAQPMVSQELLSTDSTTKLLSQSAIPETVYLAWGKGGQTNVAPSGEKDLDFMVGHEKRMYRRVLVNTPYRRFWTMGWNASQLPTLTFDFQEGDGTAGVYDKTYYGFPVPADTSLKWFVLYDRFRARTDNNTTDAGTPVENPWYDPYTSEIGNLIDIDFTLLVNGRVRASVWAYSETLGMEIPVAWLTAPTSDPEQPEAHWTYMDSGKVQFSFDGVDNIGLWNTLQSFEYGDEMAGSFGDKPMAVGRSYYAWNDKGTNLHTLIGDFNTWDAKRPNFDKSNEPYYTVGQFSQFFVKVEVANDELLRKDYINGSTQPRVVDSRTLPTANGMNTHNRLFIWQHLGEPTQVAIRMQEWIGTGAWIPGRATAEADWGGYTNPVWNATTQRYDYTKTAGIYSTPEDEGTLKVGAPVRFTFVPQAHRGIMWETATRDLNANLINAKLSRQVHHKGTVFDQFWTLYGKQWEDTHKDWVSLSAGAEKKRLANRMFHNEDHTLEFEDSAWRTGTSISAMEWVFDPSLFEKDFGSGIKEKLRYADYEQLEALPGFDSRMLGGTAGGQRSYLTMAYLSHLFYFSAFAMDRSGRRQWCLDSWTDASNNKRGWIDKTKIVTPTWRAASNDPVNGSYKPNYIMAYERKGADRYLVRSVFARQWKEPGWADGTYSGNPVTKYTIPVGTQRKLVQVKTKDFNPYIWDAALPNKHPLADATFGIDRWYQEWQKVNSMAGGHVQWEAQRNTERAIDPFSMDLRFCPPAFGTWTFDRPGVVGYHLPNPGRDFHPYSRYPVTPDFVSPHPNVYTPAQATYALNVLESPISNINWTNRDFSAQEQWFGYAWSDMMALNYWTSNPGKTDRDRNRFYGARSESTVEEFLASGKHDRDDSDVVTSDIIKGMYDVSRMDSMDRWDQFRGLIARAPYATRENNWGGNPYYDGGKKRSASAQPVKASGTYLFSAGRLVDYILAKTHNDVDVRVHWTTGMHSFWDIRFWHQYAWYSPRYFPVMKGGGAAYMFFKDEYTGASKWVGFPWQSAVPSLHGWADRSTYFDAGAWTGWRPDADPAVETVTKLRWAEVQPVTKEHMQQGGYRAIGGASNSNTTYRFMHQPVNTIAQTFTEANIFDEFYSRATGPRLAVSWVLPEERFLITNLSLPQRLSGT